MRAGEIQRFHLSVDIQGQSLGLPGMFPATISVDAEIAQGLWLRRGLILPQQGYSGQGKGHTQENFPWSSPKGQGPPPPVPCPHRQRLPVKPVSLSAATEGAPPGQLQERRTGILPPGKN